MGLRCIRHNEENMKEILLHSIFYNLKGELGISKLEEIKDPKEEVILLYDKICSPDFKWVSKTNNSLHMNNYEPVDSFICSEAKVLENSVVKIDYNIPVIKPVNEVMLDYVETIKSKQEFLN